MALTDATATVPPVLWQVTVPFGAMARIALPATQFWITWFCLLVSTVVSRVSLAFTVDTIALKFPFTSDALAGLPGVNVVIGPTGAACTAGIRTISVRIAGSDLEIGAVLMSLMVLAPS